MKVWINISDIFTKLACFTTRHIQGGWGQYFSILRAPKLMTHWAPRVLDLLDTLLIFDQNALLTKCHDHCDVPHDVYNKLTALDSLQCAQQYINNFTICVPRYQICVGELMPLSAMFVNCTVIWFSCQWWIIPCTFTQCSSVWSWSRIISYRLIRLRIIIQYHLTEIFDPISDHFERVSSYLIPRLDQKWSFRLIFDPGFRVCSTPHYLGPSTKITLSKVFNYYANEYPIALKTASLDSAKQKKKSLTEIWWLWVGF